MSVIWKLVVVGNKMSGEWMDRHEGGKTRNGYTELDNARNISN